MPSAEVHLLPNTAASSLPELLVRAQATAPLSPFVVAEGGEVQVAREEAAQHVAAAAAWLAVRGVRRGDRVAICLGDPAAGFVAAWAAMSVGAIFVSLPPRGTLGQLAHVIADAEPKLVLGDASQIALLGRASGGVPVILWGTVPRVGAAAELPRVNITPDDLAALAYTSGSTGRPKGVMISHGNFLSATRRVAGYLRNAPSDRVAVVLPLNAPWGVLQWTTMLLGGGALVLPAPGFAAELVRSLRTGGVTGLAALPLTWIQLVDWLEARGETLPQLRYVTSSGGVLPERVFAAFPRVFPRAEIFLTYGLTEAFRTTLVPPEWFTRKRGALGRPCADVEIVVRDEAGAPIASGGRGELVHRGECVTQGYWRQPDATAAVFSVGPDGRREHRSGDIVERDADGFLWFVGRRDAMIKSGGYRLSPDEIEEAAAGAGGVRQAVAWGEPHSELGQVVALAVELAEGGTKEDLLRHLRAALPSHAQPRRVALWTQPMPVTANGKIDRQAVIRSGRFSD